MHWFQIVYLVTCQKHNCHFKLLVIVMIRLPEGDNKIPYAQWTYFLSMLHFTLRKKATIHHVTTMQATSKNVIFPGNKHHLLTIGTDDSLALGR